jgi:hypothetical protein
VTAHFFAEEDHHWNPAFAPFALIQEEAAAERLCPPERYSRVRFHWEKKDWLDAANSGSVWEGTEASPRPKRDSSRAVVMILPNRRPLVVAWEAESVGSPSRSRYMVWALPLSPAMIATYSMRVAAFLAATADFVGLTDYAQRLPNARASEREGRSVNKDFYLHPTHCHNVDTS